MLDKGRTAKPCAPESRVLAISYTCLRSGTTKDAFPKEDAVFIYFRLFMISLTFRVVFSIACGLGEFNLITVTLNFPIFKIILTTPVEELYA